MDLNNGMLRQQMESKRHNVHETSNFSWDVGHLYQQRAGDKMQFRATLYKRKTFQKWF